MEARGSRSGRLLFSTNLGHGFFFAYRATGWHPFKDATLAVVYACIFYLNPIFKFDGYWILADMLGVPNLFRQPWLIARHVYARVSRTYVTPLPWPKTVLYVLCAYSVVTIIVWTKFILLLLPNLFVSVTALKELTKTFLAALLTRRRPPVSQYLLLVKYLYILGVFLVMIWQLIARLGRTVTTKSLIRDRTERRSEVTRNITATL
jgi:putative peptide zinc metalloprotease protein